MPLLKKIIVIHQTKDQDDAGSEANFVLEIAHDGFDTNLDFKDLEHDDRDKGRTDQYEFDLQNMGISSDDPGFALRMRMKDSDDGWLPSSIYALGETADGRVIVLGAHVEWQGGWFDRGGDPAGPEAHIISS